VHRGYNASGRNDSAEDQTSLAKTAVDMVMADIEAKRSRADNGFACAVAGPFDDTSKPKDPRNFMRSTSADMIPCVLFAYAMSERYPNLNARIGKFVDEDNVGAGEAGLRDDDGFQIISTTDAVRKNAGEQGEKKRARTEQNAEPLAAVAKVTLELASAVRSLAGPTPVPPSAYDLLKSALADAEAALKDMIERRGVLFEQLERLERMAANQEFYAPQLAVSRGELTPLTDQIAAAGVDVERLRRELKALATQLATRQQK
jgi:hypothetical protein